MLARLRARLKRRGVTRVSRRITREDLRRDSQASRRSPASYDAGLEPERAARRARIREEQRARVAPLVRSSVQVTSPDEVRVSHTDEGGGGEKVKTKTKKSTHVRNGGKTLEGQPLKKGDVLYTRRARLPVVVLGFKEQGTKVRLKDQYTSKERVVQLATIAAGYTRSRYTHSTW